MVSASTGSPAQPTGRRLKRSKSVIEQRLEDSARHDGTGRSLSFWGRCSKSALCNSADRSQQCRESLACRLLIDTLRGGETAESLPHPPLQIKLLDLRQAGLDRTEVFSCRGIRIYVAYKSVQARALLCRAVGWTPKQIEEIIWEPHHQWASKAMYGLAISLRGLYLKVGHCPAFSTQHSH